MSWVPSTPRWVRRVLLAGVVALLAWLEVELYTSGIAKAYTPLAGLAVIVGAGYFAFREGPRTSPITCEDLLETMLITLYGDRVRHYRANVMVPDRKRKKLSIAFSHNMKGHVDRRISIPAGKGCVGHAFVTGDIQTFDFEKMEHAAMGLDTKKTPVWSDLRSIISFPIHGEDGTVVAVLSLDSSDPMIETGFRDPSARDAVGLYAELILRLLEN